MNFLLGCSPVVTMICLSQKSFVAEQVLAWCVSSCFVSSRMLQLIQSRLQEEHSLQDVIFKSAFKSAATALPPR